VKLRHALSPRLDPVRSWLERKGALIISTSALPPRYERVVSPTAQPPVALENGEVRDTTALWERVGQEPTTYALALAALVLGEPEEDLVPSAQVLRQRILDLLPTPCRELLLELAVHERPLPLRVLGRDDEAIELGLDLGLWTPVSEGLVADAGWHAVARALHPSLRGRLHRELASRFESDDPSVGRAGLSVLEAHRHLVAAGDTLRARELARYGGAQLIEAARALSVGGDRAAAAALYGQVVEAADGGEMPVSRRLLAYARHYYHFNRAHGGMDRPAVTERGYRAALHAWPENALFWSRLIRTMFYQGRPADALNDLLHATDVVPRHPQKQTVLIARTVRGLLARDHVLDAIRVWAEYDPDTPQAEEVERRLRERLAKGWSTDELVIDPDQPLVLTRPLEVRLRRSRRWSAELPGLLASADGDTPLSALRALVTRVRAEVREVVRAYTSDLTPQKRMRKRLLLGAVDVVTSGLDGTRLEAYWFYGTLVRDDVGVLWLHTGSERSVHFEVPAVLAADLIVDDLPHLARVKTDENGVPVGPVVALEPGFRGSDDELREAWRRIQGDG
jgi:tetratricopeptide (TPR) repeat protein